MIEEDCPGSPLVVLVCGGRDYKNYNKVVDELNLLLPISLIVHGAANGADSLAGRYAIENEIPYRDFPANWDAYRLGAGGIRSRAMLRYIMYLRNAGNTVVGLAFPGGSGTADMVDIMVKERFYVNIVKE